MSNKHYHIIRLLSRVTLVAGLTILFSVQANAQRDYELFGTVQDDAVKLYWDCRAWPSDMKGFVIRRTDAGDKNWVSLSTNPVIPSMDPNTDFSNRGISPEAISDLQAYFQQMLNEGKLSVMTEAELRSVLLQNNGPGSGDRIRMKSDYNLALVLGFAFVDRTAEPGKAYQYALHAAYLDGTVSTTPLDTFNSGLQPLPVPDVEFVMASGGIQLVWHLSKSQSDEHAILGYRIARKEPGPTPWKALADHPIGFASEQNDTVMFRFQDNGASHDKDYLFELTPVNMFQQEGEPFVVLFEADKYKTLLPPQIKMVALHEEADMAIYWAIPEQDSLLIRHFVLETSRNASEWNPPLAFDTISAASRYFLDKRPKRYGEVYFYRLKAIGKYNQEAISSTETFYYMGITRPPKAEGLTYKLERTGDKTYVHLQWSPKHPTDSITQGYAIWSDELLPDSFLQLSNLPLIKENRYRYPITTQGGRIYRFRVAGLNPQGASGEPAEVSLMVGTLRMPRIYQTHLERVADKNLLIRWDYPSMEDLKGFRILVNGKQVAGTDQVHPDMRSYLLELPGVIPKEGITVTLVAVGSLAESEPGMPQRLYLSKHKTGDLPPPATIWHERVPGGIQLCWTPPTTDPGMVKGYALFADYATPGILQRLNTIPVIASTEFLITNDIVNKESMTLGVAAIGHDGTVGRIRELVVSPVNENSTQNIQKQQ